MRNFLPSAVCKRQKYSSSKIRLLMLAQSIVYWNSNEWLAFEWGFFLFSKEIKYSFTIKKNKREWILCDWETVIQMKKSSLWVDIINTFYGYKKRNRSSNRHIEQPKFPLEHEIRCHRLLCLAKAFSMESHGEDQEKKNLRWEMEKAKQQNQIF